jgi:uncharacterized membrane protein
MHLSPILAFHIFTGTSGCLSGFVAIFFRKGSRRHALAGKVFVISMLCLAASGVYLAVMKSQMDNILGGTLTFYLVATAWMTARHRDGRTGIFDWGAFLIALTVASTIITFGLEAATSPTGLKYGSSIGPYIFLGSVSVLATVGDIRMLIRGGISGTQRIARHLWRMCFAFFIAAASIFLARARVFPAIFRETGVLYILSFLPLLLMVFWLIRVRFKNAYEKQGAPSLAAFAERGK